MVITDSELDTLVNVWADYDFFYFHVKHSDSAGEDGDFAKKVRVIEQVDSIIPEFQKLKPDVIVATGDHSIATQCEVVLRYLSQDRKRPLFVGIKRMLRKS